MPHSTAVKRFNLTWLGGETHWDPESSGQSWTIKTIYFFSFSLCVVTTGAADGIVFERGFVALFQSENNNEKKKRVVGICGRRRHWELSDCELARTESMPRAKPDNDSTRTNETLTGKPTCFWILSNESGGGHPIFLKCFHEKRIF